MTKPRTYTCAACGTSAKGQIVDGHQIGWREGSQCDVPVYEEVPEKPAGWVQESGVGLICDLPECRKKLAEFYEHVRAWLEARGEVAASVKRDHEARIVAARKALQDIQKKGDTAEKEALAQYDKEHPRPSFRPPRTRHHMWCNFYGGPVEGCKQCEGLWERFPYKEGTDPVEFMHKHFPDLLVREGT